MRAAVVLLVVLFSGCATRKPPSVVTAPVHRLVAPAAGPTPSKTFDAERVRRDLDRVARREPGAIELLRQDGGFARQLSRDGGGPLDISLEEGVRGFEPPPRGSGRINGAAQQVAGMRAGFRTCYQRALTATPYLEGHSRLILKIDQDGRVVAVKAVTIGLPPTCVDCLLERAIAGRFQPPEGGYAAIAVPLTFTKQLVPSP